MKNRFNPWHFVLDNATVLIFLVLSIVALPFTVPSGGSDFWADFGAQLVRILSQLIERMGRGLFIVLALLLPIFAGMGLNFGMTLGAMAGQIGLIFAIDWGIGGAQGLALASLIGIPLSVVLGYACGSVMNKAKGREMVTGYFVGFFTTGVYWIFVQWVLGAIIPLHNPDIILYGGIGVRSTVPLSISAYSLDNLLPLHLGSIKIPGANFLIIAALCMFIVWFKRTKIGQDMRAVGSDMGVAKSAGIKVDLTRTISIILSTVLACVGQIMYLQNIVNIQTYSAHDNTSILAIAALLVGGASTKRASIANVFIGFTLLHLVFIVVPTAAQSMVGGDAQLGEYLRTFISYFIIALSLALHEVKERSRKNRQREAARAELAGAATGV